MAPPDPAASFIARWSKAEASERANYVLFLSELCDLLEVPRPDPAGPDTAQNAYVFERAVTFHHRGGKTTTGFIDLYRRGSFVCECKQYANRTEETAELALALATDSAPAKKSKLVRGSEAWDRAMLEAQGQAERYARSLPADEDAPPFLLVVDVGHVIELYADFTQKGKAYLPFPDARAHRIRLAELARPEVRAKLRTLWLDPHALDPAKVSAAVTREVAGHLAELAKSFEQSHDPATVAAFLSRCLFCMFAEDVELLPKDSFSGLLESVKGDPGAAVPMLEQLFAEMNTGKFSVILRQKILHFNGGLFAESRALPLNGTQLGLLIAAAKKQWRHVEPAIFGTLLERALNPAERHKLGAHYTPRAYVERLVLPTLVEPLREEWGAVKAAAVTLASRGDLKAAIKEARAFHHRLCAVRVLDPACGSGNFLYVALEHLKRLEGEVLQLIESFGENMRLDLGGETVDPHQFLGIEINPRAATIAELVLWIGYLQWHHRNRGATEWPEPVLRAFKNIECRDAVLAYDVEEFVTSKMAEADPKIPGLPDDWRRFVDSHSGVIFVWDQKTEKKEPVSGRNIPDEKATVPLRRYTNPAPAKWPRADFIVGNPPFIGNKRMRRDLGDGYVATLRKVCKTVPGSADFVMFWWDHAARLVGAQSAARFGLITTNTITQIQSNKVVANHLAGGLSLSFAIPDHPWVDNADGADVRIAMSACRKGDYSGHCLEVLKEAPLADGSSEISFREFTGKITSRFTTGLDLRKAKPLLANSGVCFQGVKLVGDGFQITKDLRDTFVAESPDNSARLPRYWAGKDLTEIRPLRHVIDLTALTADQARLQFPRLHEHLLTHVKPGRDANRDKGFREKWWLFGRPRMELRAAMRASPRYFVTSEVAEHRVFVALDWPANLIDGGVIAIASPDTFILGVLSSNIHLTWALEAGGNLGVGNDPRYQNEVCFDPFPFPDCTEKQKDKIRQLAEELDAHRKRAQAQHKLGLTDIYNVLEKVRAGEALTAKDKAIHEAALVSTLRQLHDDLDAAVAAAYGWPWPLTDAEILERVVALNAQRAAEEARGHIRWLRPEYQQPLFAGTKQASLGLDDGPTPSKPKAKSLKPKAGAKAPWPKTIADRAKAVESALTAAEHPLTAKDLAKQFSRANENDVQEILETLAALGRAHPGDAKGTYVR